MYFFAEKWSQGASEFGQHNSIAIHNLLFIFSLILLAIFKIA